MENIIQSDLFRSIVLIILGIGFIVIGGAIKIAVGSNKIGDKVVDVIHFVGFIIIILTMITGVRRIRDSGMLQNDLAVSLVLACIFGFAFLLSVLVSKWVKHYRPDVEFFYWISSKKDRKKKLKW